jgi:heat shock transcription factor
MIHSFLDSSNNTELIRWSDDGNSFIVLDEDEFARTLIPELFKHNNYASFVRQLNMYGFHKKVGLNANSMKAAEKKVKDPSVYWHEYFKRGRPDLLWLIQKPAAKTSSAKRKRDQGKSEPGDSEDEQKGGSPDVADAAASLMTTVPRQDMGTFRTELQKLQRQQGVISKMITSLKDQNEQFYRQATAFQALHDRHENSINAILTFLATFYNRSLDGHAGSPNLASFLSSASIPQQAQQQGSVFDMGDGDMTDSNNANNLSNQQLQRYQKPRPLLLHAPGAQTPSPSPFTNGTPSVRSSTSPGQDIATHPGPPTAQPAHQAHHQTQHGQAQTRQQAQYGPQAPPSRLQTQPQHTQRASVTPFIKDDAPTPDLLHQYPENDDVMNLINNVNASNSPSNGDIGPPTYDYALGHIQDHNNNNNTLTAQQRQDVLSLIAASGATGAGATAAQPGANNALMMPNPPPALDQFRQTKEQLDMLTKLQSEQDIKVQDLAGRLQPLSPTGAIPGITASNFDELGNPGDFDLSSYINDPEDGYFGDFADIGGGVSSAPGQQASSSTTFAAGPVPNDDDMGFDWSYAQHGNNNNGLDDTEDLFGESRVDGIDAKAGPSVQQDEGVGGMGRVVGSVSSADTSPGQTDVVDEDETPSKRLRMG